ncbi:MAG TPA: hypothetical protein VNG89_12660, partial [Vicinamibacterales bacterium]|nr:hypothetical protein [Vicinamibacterales bacterium]
MSRCVHDFVTSPSCGLTSAATRAHRRGARDPARRAVEQFLFGAAPAIGGRFTVQLAGQHQIVVAIGISIRVGFEVVVHQRKIPGLEG